MAETHGHAPDPNSAPMHSEVKSNFSALQVTIAVLLGIAAIAAGIVSGVVFANN